MKFLSKNESVFVILMLSSASTDVAVAGSSGRDETRGIGSGGDGGDRRDGSPQDDPRQTLPGKKFIFRFN